MVVTAESPTLSILVMQDRRGVPSMCTVHAPQSAIPQPNFVPVIPSTSRNTHRSGVSPSTSTERSIPLILIVKAIVVLRRPCDGPNFGRSPGAFFDGLFGGECAALQLSVQCIVIILIMRQEHISRVDLNLLRTLLALLEEKHVTRAARRCFLSQPAMSRAFERLRQAFGDELLIRVGRQYERTTTGDRLLRDLESLLPRLDLLLKGEQFEPAKSEERFRLTLTDHASVVVLPGLVRRVVSAAPRCRLEVVPWHDGRFADVEAGRLDLVLDVAAAPPNLNSEILFSDVFVCVVATRHPFKKKRFTLTEYLRYPHVVVDVLSGLQTPVDRPLASLGLKRHVGLVLPYFLPAALAVAQSDMILTTPSRLGRKLEESVGVRIAKAPRELAGFKYEMSWHARLSADRAHEWFRNQVRAVARELK
jgi:DNA-binding transcriptional LysR family regulator